jgi:hypothetical protein
MKPSFCWRSLAIGQIALVSSSRTSHPVFDVVVACPEFHRRACPELCRRDEVQHLLREPVVRRQYSVDFVEDGLGRAWLKLLA